jgi:hypothetical protein
MEANAGDEHFYAYYSMELIMIAKSFLTYTLNGMTPL